LKNDDIILDLQQVDFKVRLTKHHSEIHKNSKKLVGNLRQTLLKKKLGIVYFAFLNQRFLIPLNELKVIQDKIMKKTQKRIHRSKSELKVIQN
jgi:hypothetical protein